MNDDVLIITLGVLTAIFFFLGLTPLAFLFAFFLGASLISN
jgi:hypothetical protein